MIDFAFVDSGIGGIPYMLELLEKEPAASCVYVADTANFPYGEKTHQQVVDCVTPIIKKIRERFAPKVIILACNTISVNALETLRQTFPDQQFVGTVPAIKLAAGISKTKNIGLLATKATCQNPYNLELKEKFASDCKLICRGDGELVSFIEHNAFTATTQQCLQAVKPAVDFFVSQNCDVIVLGCTHFLNFTDIFKQACGSKLTVVDSVDGVVRHSLDIWQKEQHEAVKPSIYITGAQEKQYEVLCAKYGITLCSDL